MNFNQGLFQQQTLKLTMTQELSQAIALLQYTTQELVSFLESKALENPFIQIESAVLPVNPLTDRKKKKVTANNIQNDWLEQIAENKKSLEEHLLSQLPINKEIEPFRPIINRLISGLDENGYLSISLEELPYPLESVESSLSMIQALEPAGIGARSLQECLYLQLERLPKVSPSTLLLVKDHFEAFAEKRWKQLSKVCNIPLNEIQASFDLLQTLNPRPGAAFKVESTVFVIPDVVVIWENNEFSITVYDELLPKISLNESYYQKFEGIKDVKLSRYMDNQLQNYQWLQRSLEQRKETLQRVALKIVEKQFDFFKKGPTYLKPMVMKDIAEELDIHESTVSRAVREKYVQTPFGVFELRSFFTSTIQTVSDENASSNHVKENIKNIVEAENKLKPVSDQDMVDILKEKEGIVVSRRTIAKYREQLGIPSSSKRRRYE